MKKSVLYTEQSLTEEQQMQARKNLDLYREDIEVIEEKEVTVTLNSDLSEGTITDGVDIIPSRGGGVWKNGDIIRVILGDYTFDGTVTESTISMYTYVCNVTAYAPVGNGMYRELNYHPIENVWYISGGGYGLDLEETEIMRVYRIVRYVIPDDYIPDTIARKTEIPDKMSGATSDTDGASGLVPKPYAGDENKFLSGNGTWADLPAQVQSDYSQNDSTATDYIKNRPFYEAEVEIDLMPETEITFTGGSADIGDYVDFSNHEDGTYYLVIDGVTYEGTLDYTGNPVYDYMGVFSPYTWEIGCTLVNSDQPDGAVVARVYRKTTSIVTIDEKYLPEMPWKLTEGGGVLFSNCPYSSANYFSVAFGQEVYATGQCSFAGGMSASSSGLGSFAFGDSAQSNGECSLAIGMQVTANGDQAAAIGHGTIATRDSSFVSGYYNIKDTEKKYLRIVGNGSHSSRSNAYTLDASGNAWFSGDVYVGSSSGVNRDEGSQKLATETFVASPKTHLTLIDDTNGYNYIIRMSGGSLVSECAVSSIEVTTLPTKTTYTTDEAFDPTGMVVTATREDGTTKTVENYTYAEDEAQTTITVTYEEYGTTYTTSFTVERSEA